MKNWRVRRWPNWDWAALEGLRAGEISGGEFQLVRIARCLAQEAELLLLDEPTSLLDPANAQRVARELAALASRGKTIVFATHDIALARSLADLILLLGNHGALRLGPPAEALMPDCLGQAFGVEFGIGTGSHGIFEPSLRFARSQKKIARFLLRY